MPAVFRACVRACVCVGVLCVYRRVVAKKDERKPAENVGGGDGSDDQMITGGGTWSEQSRSVGLCVE